MLFVIRVINNNNNSNNFNNNNNSSNNTLIGNKLDGKFLGGENIAKSVDAAYATINNTHFY